MQQDQPLTKKEVIELMRSSRSDRDWDRNCDTVKERNGGEYPAWWFETIVVSGLLDEVTSRFDQK